MRLGMILLVLVGAALAAAAGEPLTLIYDHERDRFRSPDLGDALEIDVHGTPRVVLGRDERLRVVVDRTNPLLYSVASGEVEEEDASFLADLQELADLVGAALGGIVRGPAALTIKGTDCAGSLAGAGADVAAVLERLASARLEAIVTIQSLELGRWRPGACSTGAPSVEEISAAFGGLSAATLACGDPALGEIDGVESALRAAAALLATRDKPVAAAADLERFESICSSADIVRNDDGNAYGRIVVDVEPRSRWDRLRTYRIEIGVASPYASAVRATRVSGVERAYEIEGRAGRVFGVGLGLVYSPFERPAFGVIDDPSTPGQTVVGRVSGESPAGDVALFVNYRLLQHLRPATRGNVVQPGVEFGVGLDLGDTALYVGPSLQLGRFVRLGAGATWQKSTRLLGQTEDVTVVTDAAGVRTREFFDDSWYASLTVAVDSLRFFRRRD